MTKPQQNELRRSGKGATDQDSAAIKAELGTPAASGRLGPVPPGNRPGWAAGQTPVTGRAARRGGPKRESTPSE